MLLQMQSDCMLKGGVEICNRPEQEGNVLDTGNRYLPRIFFKDKKK